MQPPLGVHLTRTDEKTDEIDALATRLGGRVPLTRLLDDLDRRGRRTWLPARAVRRAWTFDAADRRDPRWWPQGITTSADASTEETVDGRRVVAVAWYAKDLPDDEGGNQGSRITFFDLDSRRYRHVLLVVPVLRDGRVEVEPLRVHAGGIVWSGPYLHVAATAKGFHTCRVDDLLRVEGGQVSTFGYDYVLPVRFAYRADTDEGHERLRFSFMSLDRSASPPMIVAGEYARGKKSRRLARFPLDPDTLLLATGDDGRSRPVALHDGVAGMQGAVLARDRWHVTVSHGPWTFGSVYAGTPGDLRQHRWATPMGPEDITYWPSTDELWSVSEHPRRRWIFAMPRSAFD